MFCDKTCDKGRVVQLCCTRLNEDLLCGEWCSFEVELPLSDGHCLEQEAPAGGGPIFRVAKYAEPPVAFVGRVDLILIEGRLEVDAPAVGI